MERAAVAHGRRNASSSEPAVALDGRMVALDRPVLPHPPGPLRVLERLVEAEHRHAHRVDQPVQLADRRLRPRPAVVPGQDVRDRDAQAELPAAPDHRLQVRCRVVDGPPLRDVVDAALDDEGLGAGGRLVEPRGDLVRALAVAPPGR